MRLSNIGSRHSYARLHRRKTLRGGDFVELDGPRFGCGRADQNAARVIILKARTPTPQAAFPPHVMRWTGSPHRGTSPPLDRASGLPSKAAIYDLALCRATIEAGTPSVRDGRDNYGLGGRCVACADPLHVGAGAPLPRGEGHKFPS